VERTYRDGKLYKEGGCLDELFTTNTPSLSDVPPTSEDVSPAPTPAHTALPVISG